VKLVEGITPGYSPSVRYTYVDLFVFGDLASIHTSMRGGAFKVSVFATLPIWYSRLMNVRLCIRYIVVD
jgi:hypothetical protein